MDLHKDLSRRLHLPEIEERSFELMANEKLQNTFLHLLFHDEDKRVVENVAWIFTHLNAAELYFIHDRCDECIRLAIETKSETLRRLLFTLLLKMPLPKEGVGLELFDFCLEVMILVKHPVGIRAQAIYLAYNLCKDYPELLRELEVNIQQLSYEGLKPGLRHAQRKVLSLIQKTNKL